MHAPPHGANDTSATAAAANAIAASANAAVAANRAVEPGTARRVSLYEPAAATSAHTAAPSGCNLKGLLAQPSARSAARATDADTNVSDDPPAFRVSSASDLPTFCAGAIRLTNGDGDFIEQAAAWG
jgi:hypothetical protein